MISFLRKFMLKNLNLWERNPASLGLLRIVQDVSLRILCNIVGEPLAEIKIPPADWFNFA